MPAGTVASLHRWPVKSMGGEPVDTLRIDARGAGGDQTHALHDVDRDKRLTAREAPRMLLWHARYEEPGGQLDPADPPRPVLTAPDGSLHRWDDPGLEAALSADLGRAVRRTRDPRGQQDLGETVLVTTQATLEAVGAELGRELDLRRFRTNVHVVLDDVPPYAEEGWEGTAMRIGEAELVCLHPCERCVIPTRDPDDASRFAELLRWLTREHRGLFGINVKPLRAATIRVGDPVEIGQRG